jgi:hypothetical protein
MAPAPLNFRAFFTRVGTYVQRGSNFCFVVLVADIFWRGRRPADRIARFFTAMGRHAALHTFSAGSLVQAFPVIYKTLRF